MKNFDFVSFGIEMKKLCRILFYKINLFISLTSKVKQLINHINVLK